ncbi:hypothetical protein DFH08DRAFT_846814 [Mycena albidolilacea]|uniref:Uncharacterized protein n=1 Tax=Mycena albidolilacea TaxID=1033008 RepID=A0AAD7AJN6_9AGAR|nr:hypothetical protein DFH08DRAFT_846814 [Mycena albidolilacea]
MPGKAWRRGMRARSTAEGARRCSGGSCCSILLFHFFRAPHAPVDGVLLCRAIVLPHDPFRRIEFACSPENAAFHKMRCAPNPRANHRHGAICPLCGAHIQPQRLAQPAHPILCDAQAFTPTPGHKRVSRSGEEVVALADATAGLARGRGVVPLLFNDLVEDVRVCHLHEVFCVNLVLADAAAAVFAGGDLDVFFADHAQSPFAEGSVHVVAAVGRLQHGGRVQRAALRGFGPSVVAQHGRTRRRCHV